MADSITIKCDTNDVSDGYHTFGELYEHRITLYMALAKQLSGCAGDVWKSELHSDGSRFDGWFVLGIGRDPGDQITYHLPEKHWDECAFAETLTQAPDFDGHTPADVLERLKRL